MMIASHKVSLGFVEALFLRLIFIRLVCVRLCIVASAKKFSNEVIAINIPISPMVTIGFDISVTNMYFRTFLIMTKNVHMLLRTRKTAGITVDMSNIDYIGVLN